MALKCFEGTNMPIVDVVRVAKKIYLDRFDGPDRLGMCNCFKCALKQCGVENRFILCRKISDYVPLFCKPVAGLRFGALFHKEYWWPEDDQTKRLEYFDWLISEYSKEI